MGYLCKVCLKEGYIKIFRRLIDIRKHIGSKHCNKLMSQSYHYANFIIGIKSVQEEV